MPRMQIRQREMKPILTPTRRRRPQRRMDGSRSRSGRRSLIVVEQRVRWSVGGRKVGLRVSGRSERRGIGRVRSSGEIFVCKGVSFVLVVSDAESLGVEMGVSKSGLDNFEEEGDWSRKKKRSVAVATRLVESCTTSRLSVHLLQLSAGYPFPSLQVSVDPQARLVLN